MKTQFLYHAEAVGASGYITLPFQETMELQAATALPINGGHGSSKVGRFSHRNIFSFESAESHVVGSFSANDNAHGTLSAVVIEGLNILDVVTCDKLVARLTSKHPHGSVEPEFMLHGSRFEGLRIAGHPIEAELATDFFSEFSTWTSLTEAHAKDQGVRGELEKLTLLPGENGAFPQARGTLGCTLARNLNNLPGGLRRNGHGIYVPHFGTVYLGEFFVSQNSRRLLMLHVDLGCSIEGCFGAGGGGGNGSPWP
jgi:hypothetical protein